MSVVSLTVGWTIDCHYSTESIYFFYENKYTCDATLSDDGSLDITAVNGVHDSGKTLNDVLYFKFGGGIFKIHKWPGNFATYFPNLQGIKWLFTEMQTITKADLQPFPNLVYLDLHGNFIRRLDGDLFKYNPLLVYLDFKGNHIDYVGKGIFNGLNQLKSVSFYTNVCIGSPGHTIDTIDGRTYTLAEFTEDLEHLCGPLNLPVTPSACSADCTSRFDKLEEKVTAFETHLTAPWYEKLKWFFKTAFGL